jgi:hypothetical protein
LAGWAFEETGAFEAAGLGAGAGAGAAAFLESKEPICSWDLYFFRIPSLWYFQNCLEASLPPTRWRTICAEFSQYLQFKNLLQKVVAGL